MGTWRVILICAAVIIVLIGAAIASIRNGFENGYQAQIQAIRAKGEPLTMEELLGPPIPDDQNAALVYNQIFATMASNEPERKFLNEHFKTYGTGSQAEDAKMRAALQTCEPILQLLEEATTRPECRFPKNWSAGPAVLFPEFAKIRELSRICSSSAIINANEGRIDDAVDSVVLGIKNSNCLDREPTLIGILVRIATMAISLKSLDRVQDHADLNANQAWQVYDALSGIDMGIACRRALMGERVTGMAAWKQLEPEGVDAMIALVGSGDEGFLMETRDKAIGFAHRNVTWKGDLATYLQVMAQHIENSETGYKELKASGLLDEDPPLPSYAFLSKWMTPLWGSAHAKRFTMTCQIDATRIRMALAACKDRFVSYPASLHELRQKLGWEIPEDPYSSEDFIYKRKGKGFILYSVGPNMKDDAGIQHDKRFLATDEKGDFVWEK